MRHSQSVWNSKGVEVQSDFGEAGNEYSGNEESEMDNFEVIQGQLEFLEKYPDPAWRRVVSDPTVIASNTIPIRAN